MNLQLGVKVVNQTRNMIIESSTHPQINGCNRSDYKILDDQIERDRDEVERKRFQIIYESLDTQYDKIITHENIEIHLTISEKTYQKILENQTHLAKEHHRGNCGEMCDIVNELIYHENDSSNNSAEIFEVKNHVIAVIGRNKEHSPYGIKKHYVYLVPFNPDNHGLKPDSFISRQFQSEINLHPSTIAGKFLLKKIKELPDHDMYLFNEYKTPD